VGSGPRPLPGFPRDSSPQVFRAHTPLEVGTRGFWTPRGPLSSCGGNVLLVGGVCPLGGFFFLSFYFIDIYNQVPFLVGGGEGFPVLFLLGMGGGWAPSHGGGGSFFSTLYGGPPPHFLVRIQER